jgi:hypothetical protein
MNKTGIGDLDRKVYTPNKEQLVDSPGNRVRKSSIAKEQ